MSIFNLLKFKSQKSCLGVDLGSSSIKIVELKKNDEGIELGTYGYAKFKIGDVRKDPVAQQEKFGAILKQLYKESKVNTRNAIASLPPFFVFSSITSLPEMPKEDMEPAIRWEARKVIPLPLEQIELKWQKIELHETQGKSLGSVKKKNGINKNVNPNDKKKIQILLTGAAKKLIQRYVYVFKRAGLNLYSLETESFALSRSLLNEKQESVIMIVDIGALNTNITVVKSGIPFLNKSIDIGAVTMSKIISNSLNISIERSEQFQYDIGVNMDKEDKNMPKIVEDALSPIINEIKYTLHLYEEYKGSILESEDKVEKIVLCGGGCMIPNLSEYLSEMLNIKVYIGDPWEKLNYPAELQMILQEIGPNFAVAIGLALRDLV